MVRKSFKIIGYSAAGLSLLAILGFVFYVYLFYPRHAESFEFSTAQPKQKILIATQSSEFKNTLVQTLCDSLKELPVHVQGRDVSDLEEVRVEAWDKILIVNTFMIRFNKDVERFLERSNSAENVLVLVTSGGNDWLPHTKLKVDALTSASRTVNISGLVKLITDWLNDDNKQPWIPEDYLLALKFLPRMDVQKACVAISSEQENYKKQNPDLVQQINSIGYQFLRLNKTKSALQVFRLNVELFPEHWNVFDSYGEALALNGDVPQAIINYKHALKLNPDSRSAQEMLSELESR